MYRTQSGRPALMRLAIGCTLAVLCLVAFAVTRTTAHAASLTRAPDAGAITVRVEGPSATLVPATVVSLGAGSVVKDGVPADSCSGLSAAGALELATRGNWSGTWSASFGAYFLTAIDGLAFPSTGAEFWSFWVNNAPASEGICGITPKPGDQLLFFPDCFGKSCPKNAGVLGVKAPSVAIVGHPVSVAVTAYSDAAGTPGKFAGALVSGGGVHAKTAANGKAQLSFPRAGHFTLRVSGPHAIRTEASICVRTPAQKRCA